MLMGSKGLELHLASPVSLKKVTNFGLLFLAIQIIGILAVRWLGNSGVLLICVIGGTVSSASTTAAAANLLTHGNICALQAGTATVLTSLASTAMNLLIVKRQIKEKSVVREITLATAVQGAVGITVLVLERWFIHQNDLCHDRPAAADIAFCVAAYSDGMTEDRKNLPLTMTTSLAIPAPPKKLHISGETTEVARRCTECQA